MSRSTAPRGSLTSNLFIRRLFFVSVLAIVLATLVQSVIALRVYEAELGPAIEAKSSAIGRVVAREVDRAVALDIPFGELRGMEEFLAAARAGHPEISYIVVGDAAGQPRYGSAEGLRRAGESGVGPEVTVPLAADGKPYGVVRVGIDERHVRGLLGEVALDIGTVLIVTLLATFEVLVILAALGIVLPIRALESLMRDYESGRFDRRLGFEGDDELARLGRRLDELGGRVAAAYASLRADYDAMHDTLRHHVSWKAAEGALRDLVARFSLAAPAQRARLRIADFAHIRAPLVVFILSEELSRSFLPIFIHDIGGPLFGFSAEIVNSLPLSFYMLMTAAFTPFAGRLVDRLGARRIFLLGCVPGVIGMLGTAFAQGVLDLLLWRGLAAIGYATSTIAAQGYLTRISSSDKRVQGMAVYVGAVMLAAICGTAIGGIVADQIGFRATFLVSAGVAALAALLAFFLLFDPPRERGAATSDSPGFGVILRLLGRPLFGILMLGLAVPAKVVLTGFLFYLTPLYLAEIGNSQSDIGRAMTAYFIVMAIGTKLVAQIADRVGKRRRFILLGGLAAGFGPLLLLVDQGFLPALIAAAAVGLGHALSTSPLMVLVTEVAARETPEVGAATVLSVFRVLERVGSVVGPFLAAAVAALYGYPAAMAGMGIVVLAGTGLFAAAFAFYRASAKGAAA